MSTEKQVAMNKATKRVLDLFESTGMGKDPFEKAVGLTEGTIKNLQNHKYNVSADTICRVAEYFDVTTDYVMGYTDFPQSPTSWFVFRRIVKKLNKSWDVVTKELNKPLSFFVDWENGNEPTELELWGICNTWQLKINPFEKTKKPSELERPETNSEILTKEDLLAILAENNGVDFIEKLYKELKSKEQRLFVLTWLIAYMASEGLPVKQILGK